VCCAVLLPIIHALAPIFTPCCDVLQCVAACRSMLLCIEARARQPRHTLERVMTSTWLYNAQSSHFARLWPTAWPTAVSFSSGADASAPNTLPSAPTSAMSLSPPIPFPTGSAASPLSSWYEFMGGWGWTRECVEVCGRDLRARGGGARRRCAPFGYISIPRISIFVFGRSSYAKYRKIPTKICSLAFACPQSRLTTELSADSGSNVPPGLHICTSV